MNFLFKCTGKICYKINTLYPSSNEILSYGQLFVVHSNKVIDFRLNYNLECDLEIFKLFEDSMRENNVFANKK